MITLVIATIEMIMMTTTTTKMDGDEDDWEGDDYRDINYDDVDDDEGNIFRSP